jgi:hypothetical protein
MIKSNSPDNNLNWYCHVCCMQDKCVPFTWNSQMYKYKFYAQQHFNSRQELLTYSSERDNAQRGFSIFLNFSKLYYSNVLGFTKTLQFYGLSVWWVSYGHSNIFKTELVTCLTYGFTDTWVLWQTVKCLIRLPFWWVLYGHI